MADFDLVKSLVSMGVDEKIAQDLKARLQGGDLMNLVNALNLADIGASVKAADPILRKYHITIGKGDQMNEYETAQLEALKSGNMFAVENFIKEWLSPVENKVVREGFNYALAISEQSRDRILDWLDENQIEYVADTPELYHIKCEDRAAAYKVSRALSEIHSKMVVRDSNSQEGAEEIMSEKKSGKQAKDAEAKLANMNNRNPIAGGMAHKTGGGAHGDGRKRDAGGRKAKHKGNRFYEEEMLEDEVVEENEALEEVEADAERVDEGVIGMNSLSPLFRLRELAGMPAVNMEPEVTDVDVVDDLGDELADVDAGIEDEIDAEFDAPAEDPLDDLEAGVPGDLPPVPTETVPVAAPSEAMSQIEDSLNSIQAQLSDIRLSEYKALVTKLNDLASQVHNMGRDYLGERRKK